MIISLYDFTGYMGVGWTASYIFDTQHTTERVKNSKAYNWNILKQADAIIKLGKNKGCTFLAAFPPCTDLAVSGAKHFETKLAINSNVQNAAMKLVYVAASIADYLSVPYFIENPVSVISSLWRKPDFIIQPYEYGGYLPEDDIHPDYPRYIKARDAYRKTTCLWTGGGFVLPEKRPVAIEPGYNLQTTQLGGKSLKTKNIRSATPRGFAQAIYELYGD